MAAGCPRTTKDAMARLAPVSMCSTFSAVFSAIHALPSLAIFTSTGPLPPRTVLIDWRPEVSNLVTVLAAVLTTQTELASAAIASGSDRTGNPVSAVFVSGGIRATGGSTAFATQTADPATATARGPLPTGIVAVIPFVTGSIRMTVLSSGSV